MTMVFAVEEINHNSSLLPGIKLGYQIMDSCDHVHTSMQALFSLINLSKAVVKQTENRFNVTKDTTRMKTLKTVEKIGKKITLTTVKNEGAESSVVMSHNQEDIENYKIKNVTKEKIDLNVQPEALHSCLTGSPVTAVIGLASSSPTRAVAHTLGPFSIPLVRQE